MSPADARTRQLVADLARDFGAVEHHLRTARAAEPERDAAQSALVALSLDHAYQAFETLLVRLERALGLPDRTGATWHGELLAAAACPIPGLRPAVVPPEAEHHWRAMLRFRHFLRHAYAVELDPAELSRNREHLEAAVAATAPRIEALTESLLGAD